MSSTNGKDQVMGKNNKRAGRRPRTTTLVVPIVLIWSATGGADIGLPVAWGGERSSTVRPQLHRDAKPEGIENSRE